MTKSTIERIAVLETKVEDVGKKIDEFFTESKIFHEEFIKHLDNLDDRYPTRWKQPLRSALQSCRCC